jgi:hypothetical protein
MPQLGTDSIIFGNGHKQKYCTPPGQYHTHDGKPQNAYSLHAAKWSRNFEFLSKKMKDVWLRLAKRYARFVHDELV